MSVLRPVKVRVCQTCPLQDCSLVMSEGPPEAELVVVGEAPNWEEVQQGRPFVGRSGRLLNELFEQAGVSRSSLYIANALKCQIPRYTQKNSRPVLDAIIHCRERLRIELRRIQPKVILALGDIALRATTGLRGISRLRGEPLKPVEGLPKDCVVLATYHPAFLLHGSDQYRGLIVRDIQRAWELVQGKKVFSRVPVKYYFTVNMGHVKVLFDKLQQASVIALDTETTGYSREYEKVLVSALVYWKAKLSCISFSWEPYKAWVLPLLGFKNAVLWSPKELEYIRKQLKQLLEAPDKKWIFHTAIFDLRFLAYHFGIDVQKVHFYDIHTMQSLVDENGPKDLESLALLYTDLGNYKQKFAQAMLEYRKSPEKFWKLEQQWPHLARVPVHTEVSV